MESKRAGEVALGSLVITRLGPNWHEHNITIHARQRGGQRGVATG